MDSRKRKVKEMFNFKEKKSEIEFFAPVCKIIGGVQCWAYASRIIDRTKTTGGRVRQYYTTAKKADAVALFEKKNVNSTLMTTRRTMA